MNAWVLRYLLLATTAFTLPPAADAQVVLPTVDVVGVSPVSGSDIAKDKVPSNVQILSAPDFDHAKAPNLLESIVRAMPGVSLTNQSGNPFQLNLDYRGFTASPVPGTPQGLAVYQNGTRVNESFGDVVNWDFIPEMAINRMTLMPNNPVFGLNAQGGAVSVEMKNGFTYHGTEVQGLFGSFGRRQVGAQAGGEKDNVSAFIAVDGLNDDGWRDFSSFSRLRRIYTDVGVRGDKAEFHLSFTGADNKLGAVAATPVEMLNQRWSSVYTWPQQTRNQLAFFQATGSYQATDTLSFPGNAYVRGFRQSHTDGNTTDAHACDPPLPGGDFLCFGDANVPLQDLVGNNVPNAFGDVLGQIDRTRTSSDSYGGSVQAKSTVQWFGHDNQIVAGASIDHGRTNFRASSELGTIDQNLFVTGTGVFIQAPDADLAPVELRAKNTYYGLYATDTFDITSRLALTAGGRFNVANIKLEDQLGTTLNSDNRFSRFNPVVGLTYKFTPNVTGYAGYSEANRAPTPLELGCADPSRPCLIDNFLISDPALKQVVSHTVEAGLRGQLSVAAAAAPLVTKEHGVGAGDRGGVLTWNVGVFHTDNDDDIVSVASAIAGRGFFQNAGKTRRQGVEAAVVYKDARWTTYANYTFVDATYRSGLLLSSPNNPFADADGLISVVPGNHIPGIPAHRFKAGIDYKVTDPWTIGADLNVVGSQYLIGDDSNLNPKVPAYWVVNLHTSYEVTKNVEVFGLVQNLFNRHDTVAGTFFQRDAIEGLRFSDPRTFVPGRPLALYAGIRGKF